MARNEPSEQERDEVRPRKHDHLVEPLFGALRREGLDELETELELEASETELEVGEVEVLEVEVEEASGAERRVRWSLMRFSWWSARLRRR